MKKISEVSKEVEVILHEYRNDTIDTKERKAKAKRVKFLRAALLYLESCPSEDFVVKQRDLVKKKQSEYRKYISQTSHLSTRAQIKAYQQEIKSVYKPSELAKQLSMINYILGIGELAGMSQ